jgi:hypothetical protein
MAFDSRPEWPDTPSFLSVYVDEPTMRERFGDPEELAIMRRLQQSFDDEMRGRR